MPKAALSISPNVFLPLTLLRQAERSVNTSATRRDRTPSFLPACACSLSMTAPVLQLVARDYSTYCLPSVGIEPSKTAALADPGASSGARCTSAICPIRLRVCQMRSSETRLRKGGCSRCTAKPRRSAFTTELRQNSTASAAAPTGNTGHRSRTPSAILSALVAYLQ